jgi:4-amino-4-deoxy-L-arabinose transferase-like glycosyltransferase
MRATPPSRSRPFAERNRLTAAPILNAVDQKSDRGGTILLVFILILAAAARIIAAIYLPDQHFSDAADYRAAAAAIRNLQPLGNPYIMPLYPLTIAFTGSGWGQLLFDITTSVVSVWLIYLLTLVLFADRIAALLAALAGALYPFFVFYAVVGLTESLFIALLLAAYLAWYRGWFIAAAVLVTLSILTRPAIDLLAPLLVVYFALLIHRLSVKDTAKQLVIYGVVYCALMTPWWIHNHRVYGGFVRLNLGSGLALYSGNNPGNQSGGVSDNQLDVSQFSQITDPVERDRAMRNAAFDYIAADPARFLHLAGLKFIRFWRLWPFAEAYTSVLFVAASIFSFVPVLLCAIASVLQCNRQALIRIAPIGMLIGYLTLVHMVIIGSVRYRLPLEPFLIVLAAPVFRQIFEFLAGFRRASAPRRIRS